jgi:hypothetical protein
MNYLRQKIKVLPKDYSAGSFEGHEFNEDVIIKHQRGCSIEHLATVHAVQPQETIVVLGGYSMLYPIFEKTMQSNLSYFQKSEIWRHLFILLRSFIATEPSHILRMFRSKYLI